MTSTSSSLPVLPTSLVGSYAQPDWLIDRAKLAGRFPPRVRARELWRVDPEHLAQAQDDATVLAIRAQVEAGLDIITDGEMRRESYPGRRRNSVGLTSVWNARIECANSVADKIRDGVEAD